MAPPVRQDNFVFEVTQQCNHDCLHCYNVWKNRASYPMGQLGPDATLSMLDRVLRETGATLVSLTGGEPLLREDIFDIMGFLHERGIAINLITNGSLLCGTVLERLVAGPVGAYEIPFLSAERGIHDRMSGRAGAFDAATLAMAELKAAGKRVVGVFVATKLNLPTWRATGEMGVAIGLDGIMFNRFNPGGRGLASLGLLQASPEELTAALDEAEDICSRYGIPIACSIPMPPCLFNTARYKKLTFGFCAAGTERAYYTLDPLGNVRPCNHSPRLLGNICAQSLREMVESPTMAEFLAARPSFCGGCRFETRCQGGCKAAAEACCGCPSDMDPFLAAFHQQAPQSLRGATPEDKR